MHPFSVAGFRLFHPRTVVAIYFFHDGKALMPPLYGVEPVERHFLQIGL
ncbi:hypothetical protein PG_0470 [Porphyromonas gingivalis W83]|uniref:Uncharacterized protein n=1 Tax=Porphyromonas gingivalis (strain ATCC BAA-308 / W83) TaxID=242619 RepID=Q7MWW4_PORGI|nr:hypothetical protein PG_0470 [Porphyromonas gingivalis W83]